MRRADLTPQCFRATAPLWLLAALALSGCGSDPPAAGMPVIAVDAGRTLPDGSAAAALDSQLAVERTSNCGNHICEEPAENLITCPSDCRPQPFALQSSFRPDPGYIDPPPDTAQDSDQR